MKNNLMTLGISLSVATIMSVGMLGCGSGSTGSSDNETSTTTGVFIDSAVSGLNYTCTIDGSTGSTNAQGEFTCLTGSNVEFRVGTYLLGSATIKDIVHPYSLYPTDSTAALNVARLLQTIDSDNNTANGISVEGNTDLNGITTPPTSTSFDNDIETAIGQALITEAEAEAHLNGNLEDLSLDGDIPAFALELSEIAGKKLTIANGDTLSFYSNMTYIENISGEGQRTGTWSVENGTLIIDVTFARSDKETIALAFDASPEAGVSIAVNKTRPIETVTLNISAVEDLIDDVVPSFSLTIDMIAGKKMVMNDGTEINFYQNMTSGQNVITEGSGVWSITNGVLIHDITTYNNGIVGTETTSIVFNEAPANGSSFTAYETYSDGNNNDIIHASTDSITTFTTASPTAGGIFDNTPVPYKVTTSQLFGKKMTITSNNEVAYFYKNMTYKVTGVDPDDSSSYVVTGTWSVENGVVIADVVMDSSESEQRVYVFNNSPAANGTFTGYLTLASDPIKDVNEVIKSLSDI